jgi:hypothetical protein
MTPPERVVFFLTKVLCQKKMKQVVHSVDDQEVR